MRAKNASDAKTSAAVTTSPGAPVVDSRANDNLTTTAAAASANAPSTTTTSHGTRNTAAIAATVFATICDAAHFTKDAAISAREDGAIENTLRNVPGCVAATS